MTALDAETRHIPVLIDEVIDALAILPGERHVDATFGAGGYTRAMLGKGATVFAFDRDPDAIREGETLVRDGEGRLALVAAPFSAMESELGELDALPVDGVTMDIGVSSMQLDRADRGFSFQADGPLDMRMSQEGESAADFVNTADEAEIARVLADYGEEVYQGPSRGFIDFVCEQHRRALTHVHQVTNILIELAGERAASEAYFFSDLRAGQGEQVKQITTWGRYIDQWSRRDGRWAIDRRIMIRDFAEVRDVTPAPLPERGRRDRSDPSYSVLGSLK